MEQKRESADPATDRERSQGDGNSLADLERNDARNRPGPEHEETTRELRRGGASEAHETA